MTLPPQSGFRDSRQAGMMDSGPVFSAFGGFAEASDLENQRLLLPPGQDRNDILRPRNKGRS
ncbi:MAG: hypothetical protein WBN42_14070 [Ignavibacteriaceae bacterium]